MSGYNEIDKAVDLFKASDCPFELMHSVSAYPSPEDQLNLNIIQRLVKNIIAQLDTVVTNRLFRQV